MKLLGSIFSKITKNDMGKMFIIKKLLAVLIHCNVVDNSCQQNSRV